jgi:serine-type D-Ala-D-Ala carboxypeptidase/endopeptidase (penicillin-binding protein 4)
MTEAFSKANAWTLTIGLLMVVGLAWVGPAWAQRPGAATAEEAEGLKNALTPLVGPRDAVWVTAPDGRILMAQNSDIPLVPASILKLLTALTALETLGPGYRFKTDFYLDPANNLKIKGYGDPLLISEELAAMAAHLAKKVISVQDLILDNTFFAKPLVIPGRGHSDEPYDAPNGALCVNFNTVAFRRDKGRWVSDEPQTPLLPLVIPKIKASGLTSGRITLAADSAETLNYTGALFQYFLIRAGIRVNGTVRSGRIDVDQEPLMWRYLSSRDLSQAVAMLLEYSNNFIANQILLVMGARQSGAPATMEKGLAVLRQYHDRELGIQDGTIVEASGISRQNRMTARAMDKILERFAPYHQLMRQKGRQFYKTGHLKGIRTRAGYLTSAKGGLYRFVVMVNTPGKTTDAIMRELERQLK